MRYFFWLGTIGFLMVKSAGAFAGSDLETINLTFNVLPTTVVKANASTSSSNVMIGPVIPGVATEAESLEVSVVTNSNDAYEVYHEVRGDLTSSSGSEFPNDELQMMVSDGTKGGQSQWTSPAPVPRERTLIFSSNSDGDADTFTVQYLLANRKTFAAGNYYGNIYLDVETI